ncbi:MAG: hypothetical protein LVR00_08360 [Rhabdochlamydiaceae bacterium]|jgi:hypothetical protein
MDIGLQTNWLDAQGTFPLTSVCHYTDHTQNRLNIWEVAQDKFFATVVSPEGRTTFLSMNRIINPLNKASPPLKTLQAIKAYPGDHWDLVYEPSRQEMIVWPHLRAAGKTSTEKAQAAASAYQQPSITDKADELGHIFRKSRGHFAQDTPENRTYILAAVSDPENKVTTTPHGIEVYLKIMEDGAQAWAYVVKGVVKNGGCNVFAQRWQRRFGIPFRRQLCSFKI